jgi:hypothetical protein
MFDRTNASTFSTHLNTEFSIVQAAMPLVHVELLEVAEKGSSHGPQPWATPLQERFSLVFRGPRGTPLQQGTYQLEHTQLGTFDLFLVPVARDHDGVYYEAVFNRLQRSDA